MPAGVGYEPTPCWTASQAFTAPRPEIARPLSHRGGSSENIIQHEKPVKLLRCDWPGQLHPLSCSCVSVVLGSVSPAHASEVLREGWTDSRQIQSGFKQCWNGRETWQDKLHWQQFFVVIICTFLQRWKICNSRGEFLNKHGRNHGEITPLNNFNYFCCFFCKSLFCGTTTF